MSTREKLIAEADHSSAPALVIFEALADETSVSPFRHGGALGETNRQGIASQRLIETMVGGARVLLKLLERLVAECRMEPHAIVVCIDEGRQVLSQVIQIGILTMRIRYKVVRASRGL